MTRRKLTFVEFCERVLDLQLSPYWRVLARVAFDGCEPSELSGEERGIAACLFGDVQTVPPAARRAIVARLGRGSGKSTIAAAFAAYMMLTADLSRVGPGMTAAAVVVAPTKSTAKLSVKIARALFQRSPRLERLVRKRSDSASGFTIRRTDGREVSFLAVAASRGGITLRGFDIVVLVADEAEFFTSNDEAASGDGYAISDRDIYGAALPRLIGPAVFISTPWPVETLTGELFEKNYAAPETALVALGTSQMMRPDAPHLEQDIANAMASDEDTARREYFCELTGRGTSRLFDGAAVEASVSEGRPLIVQAPEGVLVGCGADVAFERDACAIAVVARKGERFELLELLELRPSDGAPLQPGAVIARFAEIMKRHGVSELAADPHYRQSVIEHLSAHGLRFVDAPNDTQGKFDAYMALRATVHAGRFSMPSIPRLVSQLKSISAKPMPGGATKIVQPRRAGSGHCDGASALVAAIWHASKRKRGYYGPLPPIVTRAPSIFDDGPVPAPQESTLSWIARMQAAQAEAVPPGDTQALADFAASYVSSATPRRH